MPVPVGPGTELVPATAPAPRTRWPRPCDETYLFPERGPWAGREPPGLLRASTLLDRVGVADTPAGRVTGLKVLGGDAVDVRLLLGEERAAPGGVLAAGIGVLARAHPVAPGPRLPLGEAGPGLSGARERTATPRPPALDVTTVAYEVRAEHDLSARPELFGLAAAGRAVPGDFPGVSAFPLRVEASRVEAARQAALARLGARGFEAAAVTAVAMAGGAAPRPERRSRTVVRAVYDRPFGQGLYRVPVVRPEGGRSGGRCVRSVCGERACRASGHKRGTRYRPWAVHRHTRLVLAAGWVDEPEPYREDAL